MRILDISQPLGEATAVWPGDAAVTLAWTLRRDRGATVNVAALSGSVHAGTHADGPLHVEDGAPGVGAAALEPYLGPALVVDARGGGLVDESLLATLPRPLPPRLLVRTRATSDHRRFPERFASLSPGLAKALAAGGVRLVGVDTPSVDAVDSKTLDSHRALVAGGVAILENLVLDDVTPGVYTLIALPLRLVDADSSPVRAVLLDGGLGGGGR